MRPPRALTLTTLALGLAFALACSGGKDEPTESDPDPLITDSPTDSPTDTSPGEVFDKQDPSLSIVLGGEPWSTSQGYWNYFGDTSFLSATTSDGSRSETVFVEIDGNINYAGRYPITSIQFSGGSAMAEVDTRYEASDPGAFFVVEGFAEGEFLHGHMDGSVSVTDSIGGGGTADWTTLEAVSWPPY